MEDVQIYEENCLNLENNISKMRDKQMAYINSLNLKKNNGKFIIRDMKRKELVVSTSNLSGDGTAT